MKTAAKARLSNFINGQWEKSGAKDELDVINPATAEILCRVPLSPASEVDRAVKHALAAFEGWRRTPAGERVQCLFKFKRLIEENSEDLARTLTLECGKTLSESKGEFLRGIENIETACGIPSLMQGYNNEDVAGGIDEMMIRQPVGVVGIITPFNFPGMIPLWFMPYALACGNALILKPSEKVPNTMQKVFDLLAKTGLPKGVAQMVHGSREAVDAILDHPDIRAISFVGSSVVAKHIYQRAAANGKRVQCQGGAKNPTVILPDADVETTTKILADSAFGCAGQRCLATSVVIGVGDAHKTFTEAMAEAARKRKLGSGLDAGVEMGPVIRPESKERIEGLIAMGEREGGKIVVDGRGVRVSGCEKGFFVGPTVLKGVPGGGEFARTEIFGPVLTHMFAKTLDEAIAMINAGSYGNMSCLFTADGAAARKFRYEVRAGNIGINLGVAAPMAYFPFSGWKGSFFGDLHAQGKDAVDFYTEKKVVVERWPKEWTRKF